MPFSKNTYWLKLAPWLGFSFFITLYVLLLLPYTAGPLTWDEMLYLDLSLNPHAEPTVLFRYGHVYLQKLFLLFTPGNPMLGARIYWLFITGSTLWLVAVLAFNRSGKNIFIAFLACFFFFTQKLIYQKYIGTTYADFTVMFLGACMLALYYSKFAAGTRLFLLILLFVLGLKSKETALPLALLPLALFLEMTGKKRWVLTALAGLTALLLFVILDGLLLQSPLFSLAPESMSRRSQFDLFKVYERTPSGWTHYLVGSTLFFPLVLYFRQLSHSKERSFPELLVGFVPIACIAFLVVTMIFGNWGVEDRYILPAIPFICVLAAGAFSNGEQPALRTVVRDFFAFVLIAGVCVGIVKLANARFAAYGWNSYALHGSVMLALCILLFVMIIACKPFLRSASFHYLLLVPVVLHMLPELQTNLQMIRSKEAVKTSSARFAPFEDFGGELRSSEKLPLAVSENFFREHQQLARDHQSLVWMYHIYFSSDKPAEQLSLIQPATAAIRKLNMLLLTERDFRSLPDSIGRNYRASQRGHSVLLVKN